MKMGLVGQKLGMTRIFYGDGAAVAVTVVEVKPNVISQIKLQATVTELYRPVGSMVDR